MYQTLCTHLNMFNMKMLKCTDNNVQSIYLFIILLNQHQFLSTILNGLLLQFQVALHLML